MHRLSVVQQQVTWYSQRVPGYVTRYSMWQQIKSIWQKIQPIRLCLLSHARPVRKLFSTSTWWLLQTFRRPNCSNIQNMASKYYFFLNGINQVEKYIINVRVKRKLDTRPASQSGSKPIWFPWCLMPIGVIHQSDNLNTQSTVLTKNSVLVTRSRPFLADCQWMLK